MASGPFIVDIVLYTGQFLQSKDILLLSDAAMHRDDLVTNTMVEAATIIDCKTGECVPYGYFDDDGSSKVTTRHTPAERFRHKHWCPRRNTNNAQGECTCHSETF